MSPAAPMRRPLARAALAAVLACVPALATAAEPAPEAPARPAEQLEVNNAWSVRIANGVNLTNPVYVTLRQVGRHWEIDGLFNSPPKLPRSQDLELFMATRDLQEWTNAHLEMRADCDHFEVRESDFHSVCTSRLAEKKPGLAALGLLFGGNGRVGFGYTNEKVKAAINSIRPQQAIAVLDAFERGTLSAGQQAAAAAATQQKAREQAEQAQGAARQRAAIGAKDWCEQTVKYFGTLMQVESTYTCQNYGVVTEETLRREGWAITDKKARKVGYAPQLITVHDLAIEKVPR